MSAGAESGNMEFYSSRCREVCPAPEPGQVSQAGNHRRNDVIATRVFDAGSGNVTRPSDAVISGDYVHRDVLDRVHDHYVQADAVRNKKSVVDRIDDANVERVKWPAGGAGGIVLWHRDDVDDAVAIVHGRAAHGAVLGCAAAVSQHKQNREKKRKQNSGSHRISSCDFPYGTGRGYQAAPPLATLGGFVHTSNTAMPHKSRRAL